MNDESGTSRTKLLLCATLLHFLSHVNSVNGVVYWNPGDAIHRHNVEFNKTYYEALSWSPPITISRVVCPPRLEDEIAFVNKRYAKTDATERLDIFRVESSWLRQMEQSLYDLTPRYGSLMTHFDPRVVKALTVNGKLLAIPSFLDFSLIYYRKDLLQQFNRSYPTTWNELENTASYIQTEMRKLDGNEDFWGFMWQGSPNEILTILTMTFVASHGGGNFIEHDGTISIDNPNAMAAFERAKRWLNWITPSSIVNQHLHETKLPFLLEKALFLVDLTHIIGEVHSWTPMGSDLFSCGSRSFNSHIGLGYPPGQPASNNVSVPWFWGWAVNKYSPELNETLAVLDYLASEQQQLFKAESSEDTPTRLALLKNDSATCGNRPQPTCCDIAAESLPLLDRALDAIGTHYFEISPLIFNGMHEYLVGNIDSSSELVEIFDCEMHKHVYSSMSPHCKAREKRNEKRPFLYPLGIVLFLVNSVLSLVFMLWVYSNRDHPVVVASQRYFLYSLCTGCTISSVALIFVGADDRLYSRDTLDIMCQGTVWFSGIGFMVTTISLISKTYRVKILVMDAPNNDRRKIMELSDMKRFSMFIAITILAEALFLAVWTVVAPLKWVRKCIDRDGEFGYCKESIAHCEGEVASIAFLTVLFIVHLIALFILLYLCYIVRLIPSEFSEHKWITASAISSLEILFVMPPFVALSWNNITIVSTLLMFSFFINDFGVLSMMFFPKLAATLEDHNEDTIRKEEVLFALRKKARRMSMQDIHKVDRKIDSRKKHKRAYSQVSLSQAHGSKQNDSQRPSPGFRHPMRSMSPLQSNSPPSFAPTMSGTVSTQHIRGQIDLRSPMNTPIQNNKRTSNAAMRGAGAQPTPT